MQKSIVLITGASSGIGREFAIQLDQDPSVNSDEFWLVARREKELQETASRLRHPSRLLVLDLTDQQSFVQIQRVLEQENPIVKFWVNNAGFGAYGLFENLPLERNLGMVQLNIAALVALSHISLPYLTKGSVLLNVASLAAYFPLAHFAVYSATKAFVKNFSVALAAELEPKGILVHTLSPGPVKTEFGVVASAGAKSFMDYGQDPAKTVKRCLAAVKRRSWWSHPSLGWKLMVWMSRWFSIKTVARFSRKFMVRSSRS
jgi:short-subunit dehydrogenase